MAASLDFARRDLQTVRHPCTQMKDHEWLPMISNVRGLRVYQRGLRHEARLRPIGIVADFMRPYVITPDEIDALAATARAGIEAATCD